jgi:hypothetical protein
MKLIVFVLLSCVSLNSHIQADSWRITHNGRLLLQANEENPQKNVATINRIDLNKTDFLWVRFAGTTTKGWVRSIYISGEKDEELARHSGNLFRISNSTLKALFKNRGRITVYTYTMPTDPKMKAAIKIRRVHLCTIFIK